ncbi:DUF917 domain-containing protein [Amycolatopsis jejuensis]|uniref:DUF917 domain-containing protein n=1 Tax=Amycolatopsis jejuensis TaxID=330084 RepID=UPI000A97DD4E|nr:DUF917 domain-containing protein [Amycolatopsis jejuensis]
MQLDETVLDDLVLGATILAAGGGGDPYLGKLMARRSIREHGPVQLLDVAEVPDDARIAFVAGMGAPSVVIEKLPRASEVVAALDVLEEHLGYRFTHLAPAEAGGLNAVIPVTAAALRGIPMLDADGMGRAFPSLDLVTPALYGASTTPLSLVDEHGNRVVITTETGDWADRVARAVMITSGCVMMSALYPMTGAQAKAWLVRGALSLATRLGEVVRTARERHESPVDAVVAERGGARLFDGKVVDVRRATEGGWTVGEAVLQGLDSFEGREFRLGFRNEYLVASRDGGIVATTPDLLMALELENGTPIPAEEIRYGYRVAVIGLPCDERWRSEAGLRAAGPRRFGYDVDFSPVEAAG